MILEILAGAAVLDEIATQSKPSQPLPYKVRTPRDHCYHGAWNWRDCGECSKLGRKFVEASIFTRNFEQRIILHRENGPNEVLVIPPYHVVYLELDDRGRPTKVSGGPFQYDA